MSGGSGLGKLAVNKSLNEYDDFDDDATTHSSRMVCPSHPHKKVRKSMNLGKIFPSKQHQCEILYKMCNNHGLKIAHSRRIE